MQKVFLSYAQNKTTVKRAAWLKGIFDSQKFLTKEQVKVEASMLNIIHFQTQSTNVQYYDMYMTLHPSLLTIEFVNLFCTLIAKQTWIHNFPSFTQPETKTMAVCTWIWSEFVLKFHKTMNVTKQATFI